MTLLHPQRKFLAHSVFSTHLCTSCRAINSLPDLLLHSSRLECFRTCSVDNPAQNVYTNRCHWMLSTYFLRSHAKSGLLQHHATKYRFWLQCRIFLAEALRHLLSKALPLFHHKTELDYLSSTMFFQPFYDVCRVYKLHLSS